MPTGGGVEWPKGSCAKAMDKTGSAAGGTVTLDEAPLDALTRLHDLFDLAGT